MPFPAPQSKSPLEQRRSRRYRHLVEVDVTDKRGTRRGRAVDVARHGLFVAVVDPPHNRHLVQLVVHLPDGPLAAAATVSRVLPGQGVGLSLFALSSHQKGRWDRFIAGVERAGESAPHAAAPTSSTSSSLSSSLSTTTTTTDPRSSTPAFVVRLKTMVRLQEYGAQHVAAGGTVLYTPVLPPAGSAVRLLVVHPESEAEFVIEGVVHRAIAESPKRLEILFHDVDAESFQSFVRTGLPKASPSIIAMAPGPAPLSTTPTLVPQAAADAPTTTKPMEPGLDFDIDLALDMAIGDGLTDEPLQDDPIDWDLHTSDLPVVLGTSASQPPAPAPPPPPSTTSPATLPTTSFDDDPVEELLFDETSLARDPGHRPTPFLVRCDQRACPSEPYTIELGPCAGLLGLVADMTPFWSDESRRLVCVPRSVPAEQRRERFVSYVTRGGQMDDLVPISAFLVAVDLAERPRHPDTAELLRASRAVERVVKTALHLAPTVIPSPVEEVFAQTQLRCPHCDHGHLELTRI